MIVQTALAIINDQALRVILVDSQHTTPEAGAPILALAQRRAHPLGLGRGERLPIALHLSRPYFSGAAPARAVEL